MVFENVVSINNKNHLEIGGCDCVDLVEIYKTPLYLLDESIIRENCRIYKNALNNYCDGNGLILYASKAFCTMAMCRIVMEEGLGLDVVSGGELYTALKASFPTDKVYFHGNNKTINELEMAIENNVGRIIVDNEEELNNIEKIAQEKGKVVKIAFRIKPGIEAHTHDFIRTGQIDSKFGVSLENNEAINILKKALEYKNVEVVGLHCHIGSQIFDLEPFELAAKVMVNFIYKIKQELGLEIHELNLGGGFGIKYVTEDDPIEYNKYIEAVSKVIKEECSEKDLKFPFIVLEPGRSIVSQAGITLYTVGNVKHIEGIRKYIAVDGGMGDNPRYALYQAQYHALLANAPNSSVEEKVTIAGKCCESGDILIKDIKMPNIKVGDVIAVLCTGAYNYSMASNYNRIPKPPVVLVKNGQHRLIVKREDYDDIIRNDIIPKELTY